MTSRRDFLIASVLLPLPAAAQAPFGVVHQLVGDVTLNDVPLTRQSALQSGQTIRTGAGGRVWFSIGADAYFLRPNSRLRLDASKPREPIIDFLRLVTGALGATFQRGSRRTLVAPTATIGIRGTGVYLEATPEVAYFCTCFGATEILAPSGSMMRYLPTVDPIMPSLLRKVDDTCIAGPRARVKQGCASAAKKGRLFGAFSRLPPKSVAGR
jgi:hypothetical protein